jgi:predicted nucleotidyltransferase
MDLSNEQVEAICAWARETPQVSEVRLFGSRAKGRSKPGSDVDLAVTASIGGYWNLADKWEKRLSEDTGLTVHIRDYAGNEVIRLACEKCSVPLYPLRVVA